MTEYHTASVPTAKERRASSAPNVYDAYGTFVYSDRASSLGSHALMLAVAPLPRGFGADLAS